MSSAQSINSTTPNFGEEPVAATEQSIKAVKFQIIPEDDL
jgi:hypothetical protein